MKTKRVVYMDMFDMDKKVVAPNKLPVNKYHMLAALSKNKKFHELDPHESYLRSKSHLIKCKCHHPVDYGTDGICTYRSCRHKIDDHPFT